MSVEQLELDVQKLKGQVASLQSKVEGLTRVRGTRANWLTAVVGRFENDPDFDELVRLGREYRTEANLPGDTPVERATS